MFCRVYSVSKKTGSIILPVSSPFYHAIDSTVLSFSGYRMLNAKAELEI